MELTPETVDTAMKYPLAAVVVYFLVRIEKLIGANTNAMIRLAAKTGIDISRKDDE